MEGNEKAYRTDRKELLESRSELPEKTEAGSAALGL
jgi:hypothetical protein